MKAFSLLYSSAPTDSRRRAWRLLAAVLVAVLLSAPRAIAEEMTIAVESLPDPVIVWTPDDFANQPDRQWPVVFWYPGTGGIPSVDFICQHVGQRDWVVVGMGFREPGRFEGNEPNVAAELAILHGVRQRLAAPYRLDPARQYVGGFSKGGWVSGMFLTRDPPLAGALILGAGWLEPPPTTSVARPRRAVYAGIGELDGNRAMIQRVVRESGLHQIAVTLDVWEGLGHRGPDQSECLQQWLRVAAAVGRKENTSVVDPLIDEAVTWFDAAFGRLTNGEEPLPKDYFALDTLCRMPFFAILDEESRSAATKKLTKWTAHPKMALEISARRRYDEILERESRDRMIGTLEICRDDYRTLAESAPGTIFSAAAGRAAERAGALLK